MTAALTHQHLTYKYLLDAVDPELWDRLVGRIVREDTYDQQKAERIMDAALGFLKMCADFPEQSFAPSEFVDIGWHTFIMYTKGYHAFCERYASEYIHHEPSDGHFDRYAPTGESTLRFMKEHGITYDPEMWSGVWPCQRCSDCQRCKN